MDFDETSTKLIPQEFLAVVLAGFGNELLPLTGNYGDEPSPKALLPIANKPMLEYPLVWIEQSVIRDVLLICPTAHRSALSNYVQSDASSAFPSLRIDLQTYDETQESSVGTCTILRHFSHRIQQDFVLLPCDFVSPPSFSLSKILNKFRTESTYDGAIATACFFESRKSEKGSTTEEWGVLPSAVPVVRDDRSGTLLYVDSPDDLDTNGEELELRMSLLSRYPRARLSANLEDSHVYVCRRQVLDALNEKPQFDSIREEFIPWLCKPQYQRVKRVKYGHILSPNANALTQALALKHSTLYTQKHGSHLQSEDFLRSPASDGQTEEHSRSILQAEGEDEDENLASLRIGLVVQRADAGYAARANNLQTYLELNRHFLSQTTYALPTDQESRSLIDHKAQISSDSMIGHSTRVEERTNIKKSMIGQHCIIGKMVKIVGCVIQDHCVIADGAKLDGCILGKGTKVGEKAELSRCVTQCGYEVSAGDSIRNEKLDITDWTAPLSDEEESDDGNGDTQSDDSD
ncbi:UDP-3-O-glucosamine N-acyltransferase [Laetiporus sulphureus 93-53]|uniref:Translation initiation factor eIF2B subunit gamma n=1 Tax=Laetiporus sulphureus 93-53 TaxID=1314785 RepID=A0A165H029_9APHY|nr:UDP-3-O-glucosamine N-acyltransferase [Laetiporus sulphureus 93-53]KZT11063.1 UDP-3-O-glucosamine N-acyltransferase [Laetiporus sulphureus 93-53]